MFTLGKCVRVYCYMCPVYACTSWGSVCVTCMQAHPRKVCVCILCYMCPVYACAPQGSVCVCVLCMHIQQSLFQSCEHVSDCEPMCKHVFLSVNERCVGAYEQMCVSLCE